LAEDSSTNRMRESLRLFKEVKVRLHSHIFRRKSRQKKSQTVQIWRQQLLSLKSLASDYAEKENYGL
jgi:hypothetical protein